MGCDFVDSRCSFISQVKGNAGPVEQPLYLQSVGKAPNLAKIDQLTLFGIRRVGIGFRFGGRRELLRQWKFHFAGGELGFQHQLGCFGQSCGIACQQQELAIAHPPVVRGEPKPFRGRVRMGHGSAASYTGADAWANGFS